MISDRSRWLVHPALFDFVVALVLEAGLSSGRDLHALAYAYSV